MGIDAFQLFPAIDVLQGACVRLQQGDYGRSTTYAARPVDAAARWLAQGAGWLHVVDLDGAKSGLSTNTEVIAEVVREANAAGVRVQVGGGIRDYETMERWLTIGVIRCVIGTAALDTVWTSGAVERFGSDAVIVGLDGRNGQLAVNGWLEQTQVSLVDIGRRLYEVGVRCALVTDVERDGTLNGANLQLAAAVQIGTGLQTIASGGVQNLDDVLAARDAGLAGAIVGRSLYDGTLSLEQAYARLSNEY
jgi:phosphoribosylformimino-5-aminoimidazole carboxamide ribotide isomerase